MAGKMPALPTQHAVDGVNAGNTALLGVNDLSFAEENNPFFLLLLDGQPAGKAILAVQL